MDLATATPVETDTELGRLYAEAYPYRRQIEDSTVAMYALVNGTEGKDLAEISTHRAAEDRARKLAVELPRKLATLDAARAKLAPLADAEKPLEAEYLSRGRWTRFFLVTSSDGGHIHRSMDCSTCTHTTQYMWMPEFSGMTMAEAIAEWDKRKSAEILCSVCFPDAPVARLVAQVPDTQCPGSGTLDYPRETARINYAVSNGGYCSHCGQWVPISKLGRMRKHDKTPAAPKVSDEKLAKAITPDGSELKIKDGHGSSRSFKTERSAISWAVENIGFHRNHGYTLAEDGIRTVTEAYATKHGITVDEATAYIDAKVTAWTKRNGR